jgi:capsular polysaccharide biosynthesis protein
MMEISRRSEAFPRNGRPKWTAVYGRAPVPEQRGQPFGTAGGVDPGAPLDGTGYRVIQHAEPAPSRHRDRARLVALAAAVFVIVTAGSLSYSLLQPKVYGATAEFILTPQTDMTDAAAERAMETQVMITESRPVLEPVSTLIGMPLGELREATSAEVIGRSNVLRLTVGDRDQARAVRLIQLITEEYLRASAPTGPAATTGADTNRLTQPTLLSAASPTARPLQPRPMRAVVVGVLLGMIAAFAAVTLVVRPRFLFHPSVYWK